jgi:hypothetical protein
MEAIIKTGERRPQGGGAEKQFLGSMQQETLLWGSLG